MIWIWWFGWSWAIWFLLHFWVLPCFCIFTTTNLLLPIKIWLQIQFTTSLSRYFCLVDLLQQNKILFKFANCLLYIEVYNFTACWIIIIIFALFCFEVWIAVLGLQWNFQFSIHIDELFNVNFSSYTSISVFYLFIYLLLFWC